jgi:hypothetical protein
MSEIEIAVLAARLLGGAALLLLPGLMFLTAAVATEPERIVPPFQ